MHGQGILSHFVYPQTCRLGIEDPKGKSIEKVVEIRDEIEQRVKELISGLGRENKEEG